MLCKKLMKSRTLLFPTDHRVAIEKHLSYRIKPRHFWVYVNQVLIHISLLFHLPYHKNLLPSRTISPFQAPSPPFRGRQTTASCTHRKDISPPVALTTSYSNPHIRTVIPWQFGLFIHLSNCSCPHLSSQPFLCNATGFCSVTIAVGRISDHLCMELWTFWKVPACYMMAGRMSILRLICTSLYLFKYPSNITSMHNLCPIFLICWMRPTFHRPSSLATMKYPSVIFYWKL